MRLIAILLFVVSATACRATPEPGAPAQGSATSSGAFVWRTGQPAEVGMDSTALAALDADFKAGKYHYVDAMFVTRHGVAVADAQYEHDYKTIYGGRDTSSHIYNYYDTAWHPYYNGTRLHTLQSVTKSVTSIVVGLARTRRSEERRVGKECRL